MINIFGKKRQQIKKAAGKLYETAVAQARCPVFYEKMTVEDSLDGRFDLLTLHVFLLLYRLGKEGEATRSLAQELFDLMFADMDRSLRELGVSDMSIGGKIKTMAGAFYGRVSAYEDALTGKDEMRFALSRNLYRGRPVADLILIAMEKYIKDSEIMLNNQDKIALSDGCVNFILPE